jgi:hypothetical protein
MDDIKNDTRGRRQFLTGGAITAGSVAVMQNASAKFKEPEWMRQPGSLSKGYSQPSEFEENVQRALGTGRPTVSPGTGASRHR